MKALQFCFEISWDLGEPCGVLVGAGCGGHHLLGP